MVKKNSKRFLIIVIAFLIVCTKYYNAYADDSICSKVKIEINQELTLERQAFDAHMRINNGLSHISLENVSINVSFADSNKQPVTATNDSDDTKANFFIRLDYMDRINSIDGNGTVAPSTSADIHWLIIPAYGAARGEPNGTLYYVGATLTYSIGGVEHITEVTPDYIYVKPMPMLTLDYFLPRDVFGDDPFTTEIEPEIPFSLGLRVNNIGIGTARNMKIDTAQPEIIDNFQGLLVNYVINKAYVQGWEILNSLKVNFGDIAPGSSVTAQWDMTCSISGQFRDFKATFIHADELGGELTSLLQATNTHRLIHNVLVDLPGRDYLKDFLAYDSAKYTVYESQGNDTKVLNQSEIASITAEGNDFLLSTPITDGFMYIKLEDPHKGEKNLLKVLRSDGKILHENNVWLSKTRNDAMKWEYYLNLFDVNTTDRYVVNYEMTDQIPKSPILDPIDDVISFTGESIRLKVTSRDPDNTVPSLSASPCPYKSVFRDNGDGTGSFEWNPDIGQKGRYQILFTASDGELKTSQTVHITINDNLDKDGDSMPDEWEMQFFGHLDRDGTGDLDGDGINDLSEHLNGLNPTISDLQTSPPIADAGPDQLVSPGTQVFLNASNSTDPDDDIVSLKWSQIHGVSVSISDGSEVTPVFIVPESIPLSESCLIFQLTVTDQSGHYDNDICIINIANDNMPPIANAGGNQQISYKIGDVVSLNGSESIDPEDKTLSYEWIQIHGKNVELFNDNTATPGFFIPSIGQDGETFRFRLIVTDDVGFKSKDECLVSVLRDNNPPVAKVITEITVREGDTAILDASESFDQESINLSYKWKQLKGLPVKLSDPDRKISSLIAPMLPPEYKTSGMKLLFRLMITDTNGLQSETYCNVNLILANNAPISYSDNIYVDEDGRLTYTLNAGDADSNPLTYTLIDLPAKGSITLTDATSGLIDYTPYPNITGKDTFSFKVNDGTVDSNIASITIVIQSVDDPPIISDIENQQTYEDISQHYFAFTLTDADGGIVEIIASSQDENIVSSSNITINAAQSYSLFLTPGDQFPLTCSIHPSTNQHGKVIIAIKAIDEAGLTDNQSFTLTVIPINDAPKIQSINNQQMIENKPSDPIEIKAWDLDGDQLIYSAMSSNPELIPGNHIQFEKNENGYSIKLYPSEFQYGMAMITVMVTDPQGLTDYTSFVASVSNVVEPGDINDDQSLDLIDLITGLQIIGRIIPDGNYFKMDINSDDQFGIAELIYIFQKIINKQDTIPGDFDGSGVPDLNDVSMVLDILSGQNVYPSSTASDLNGDGKIELSDLIYLLKMISSVTFVVPGDLDGNGELDLVDATTALEIISGGSVEDNLNVLSDINNDGQVSLEDIIYIILMISKAQ